MVHRPTPRELTALLLLACALSVLAYHLAADLAPRETANDLTFRRAPASRESYLRLRQEWRPRVGSALSARLAGSLGNASTPADQLRTTVGLHTAGWLLATNLLLILGFGRRALVLMWGVAAAVAFGYAPGLVSRVYPWDLPALFFFTAFAVTVEHDRWRWLPVVILVGALFKETTAVLCIAPLFRPIPWRRRGVWSAALAGGFLVLKLAVDLAVQNPVPLFSPTVQPPDGGSCRLGQNLRLLLSSPLAHPIWLNAGTLAALALIPSRIRLVSLTRTVAVCFALSIFVFGVVSEYRIWFEMAPLAVVALSRWLSPADVARELQQ